MYHSEQNDRTIFSLATISFPSSTLLELTVNRSVVYFSPSYICGYQKRVTDLEAVHAMSSSRGDGWHFRVSL